MPKVNPLQDNFNGGELSPLARGRVSSERYKAALELCQNYIPTVQGGLISRPGTRYVGELKSSSNKARLFMFEPSAGTALFVEMGPLYLRYFQNGARHMNGASPTETVTPYVELALPDIHVAEVDVNIFLGQSNSQQALLFTNPSYRPRLLYSIAPNNWVFQTLSFTDGPYLDQNTTGTTLTASAGSGAITITASAVTGINGGAGFATTDVDRAVRIKSAGGAWGWARITGWVSTTVVNATVVQTVGTVATTEWRLGLWSDTTGWPASGCIHEDRLVFFGGGPIPRRVDGSRTGFHNDFRPTDYSGTPVTANSDAYSFALASNKLSTGFWITSDEKGLLAGSAGYESIVRPSSQGEGITPTNVSAKTINKRGSALVQPVQVGKSTIFVQKDYRKLRELTYFYDVDGHRSPDISVPFEHLTKGGIKEMAFQPSPHPILWPITKTGKLIGVTYEREDEQLRLAGHRHVLGGVSDAANSDPLVESQAIGPTRDGLSYEQWLIVNRRINGATKRYIEYVTQPFEEDTDPWDAFHVDCGKTFDGRVEITGITKANPGVVTAAGHGFVAGEVVKLFELGNDTQRIGMNELNNTTATVANPTANTFELSGVNTSSYSTYLAGGFVRRYRGISGATKASPVVITANSHGLSAGDKIRIFDVEGMTELNGNLYTVANPTANTFELSGVDGTGYTTYVSGGEARKCSTVVTGASHLEGQTVQILADGAQQASKTVSGGQFTLDEPAAIVHYGLGYKRRGKMLPIEAGAAAGTAHGRKRRTNRVGFHFFRTGGFKFGLNGFDSLEEIEFRTSEDEASQAPPLFTGIKADLELPGEYDTENQICWEQDCPLPGTLLAVMPQMHEYD